MNAHDDENVFTLFAGDEEPEDEFVHPAEVRRRCRRLPRRRSGEEPRPRREHPRLPRLELSRLSRPSGANRLVLAGIAAVVLLIVVVAIGSGGGGSDGRTEATR